MLLALRHLIAIVALPLTVTIVVPFYLLRPVDSWAGRLPPLVRIFLVAVGGTLLSVGIVLFISSIHQFATRGRGTLAPWDPPRDLVVSGPYRFVRNPMISGVIFILFSEAALLQSPRLLSWAVTFLLVNLIYIPILEEPQLVRRFGEPYREYCRHVRRFIPRVQPWTPGTDGASAA